MDDGSNNLAEQLSPEIADSSDSGAATLAEAQGEFGDCCLNTIRTHVKHNPMMVCDVCKNIIKCFLDRSAYQNYLTFCRSRRRPITVAKVDGYFTIGFKSYDKTYRR